VRRERDLRHYLACGPGRRLGIVDADVLAVERAQVAATAGRSVILTPEALGELVELLRADGRRVIGPRRHGDVVELAELDSAADLPIGLGTELGPGSQRVVPRDDDAWFGYAVGPVSPKHWLSPPRRLLWRATRSPDGFTVFEPATDPPQLAFLGLRPCELAAMDRQDQVHAGPAADPDHAARRQAAFVVAVGCHSPAATCFCASTGTGPDLPDDADGGRGRFDIGLVELLEGGHRFLARAGSAAGAALLERLPGTPAGPADLAAAEAQGATAATAQTRRLPGSQGDAGGPGLAAALAVASESPRWAAVAARCLACGSCTQVCPTCFCHTVDDTSDLIGEHAERWRRWDSCFTNEFSRLHGGSVRTATSAKYRQWLSHKLGTWWDQFGTSGCVGCGRCITWCPVGIDITEEAHALVGGLDPLPPPAVAPSAAPAAVADLDQKGAVPR
jgi:sulfhydrogenase subunit beta (sulfur reductase)